MAKVASNITVAADGDIAVAPVGTVLPTGPGVALDAAFEELGYASEDGVTFSFSQEVEDQMVWQSLDPVRSDVTSREFTAQFELAEWKAATFALAFGGGIWETTSDVHKYSPPAAGDSLTEYSLVINTRDGDREIAWVIPRCRLDGDVETQAQRGEKSLLPVTLKALLPDDASVPWYPLTEDDAFEPGS